MHNFAIIGAAGFIAPRHLKAIKETGNNLVAALDPFDSVGIIDSYFPDCAFFTEFERFDRHAEMLRGTPDQINYVTVCSPNYLHDAHIRFGLRIGANVICEKPLVLNPWNLKALERLEYESNKKIYNVLQLRLHPEIVRLKRRIDEEGTGNVLESGVKEKIHEIELTYITSRGNWYYSSWKGDISKSGGVATNIGVHFYDMLSWIFGTVEENIVHISTHDRVAGSLHFKKAHVKYFLSINFETLPKEIQASGKRTYRSIKIDEEELEFSEGFTDLHTESYKQILSGNGFGIGEAINSIDIVHKIRHAHPIGDQEDAHLFSKLPQSVHPFKRNRE
jgi:UDP-N-acetyl-2-amino-2-deoxyglucuronate dehydrogenase